MVKPLLFNKNVNIVKLLGGTFKTPVKVPNMTCNMIPDNMSTLQSLSVAPAAFDAKKNHEESFLFII